MDQAGAAEEGQRPAVSEPTPQEPRSVGKAEFLSIPSIPVGTVAVWFHRRPLHVFTARDGWKKKYFETKKDTVPLEEKLRGLQQQLEMFYNKLLQQLQARDHRGKQRQRGRASVKVHRFNPHFLEAPVRMICGIWK